MPDRRQPAVFFLGVTAMLAMGCVAVTSPDRAASPPASSSAEIGAPGTGVPDFLTLAPGAPALATTTLNFYAIKGSKEQVFLWYHAKPGATDSTPLLRFRLDPRSLCNRPDGTPIPPDDSLLITITVVDPAKQIVQFEPSGLRFCPGREAKLNMWYAEDNHDFDNDGDIDARDKAIERRLRVWRQESAGSPWSRLFGVVVDSLDEVEVLIPGFTNYVVAY